MKIWSSEHVFNHPWEVVARAAWRKYPNPQNPNVVGTDVLERSVNKKGQLVSHRVLTTEWGFPSWVSLLVGLHPVTYASEHSVVDPKKKSLSLRSCNLSLQDYITVDEELVYTPHPTIKNATLLRQEAVVRVHGLSLASRLEQIVADSISSNSSKGREAMEWVIKKINTEMREFASSAKNCLEEMNNPMQFD